MFGNFKLGKPEEYVLVDNGMLSPTLPILKTRGTSVSTAVDQNSTATYKRNHSNYAHLAIDTRTNSSASASAPISPSKPRTMSNMSRRSSSRSSSSSRRFSWWRSANPEENSNIPAVSSVDRKYSLFGSHNPDSDSISVGSVPSPTTSRRLSYVPRNAASSFLRTTTPLSVEEKAEVTRRASVADLKPTVSNVSSRPKSIANPRITASNKPAPLFFTTTSPAYHGLHSMEGACDIDDSTSLISPRANMHSYSMPHSPADTIMEDSFAESFAENAIDSAKASPEFTASKGKSLVSVSELTC
jgi:hypothetical protein